MNDDIPNHPAMNDSFVAPTSQMPAAPAVSTPVVTPPAMPQTSAVDRLEALLKQLQEEKVETPAVPAAVPPAPVVSSTAVGQDFASALSRVPVTPVRQSDTVSTSVAGSLDSVIKTLGEQFEMGQPTLSELLQLAKQTTQSGASTAPTVSAPTPSPSPMQFARPHNGLAQAPAMPAVAPKITVMPPAESVVSSGLEPVMAAVPVSSIPEVKAPVPAVPIPAVIAPTSFTPTASPEPTPVDKPRVLNQYLKNLAVHLQQHGQLNLPSYSKLVVSR